MWETKIFKTAKALADWIASHSHRYQIIEIAVNNAYGVEYRKLVSPRLPR